MILMKIHTFMKNIYGGKLYCHAVPVMVLAFVTAAAQFVVTQHLGLIIDAVEAGYEETMRHFFVTASALLVYMAGTASFTFFSRIMAAGFARRLRTQLGEKICAARYQQMERMEEGELLTIVGKDVESLKDWLEILLKTGALPAVLVLGPVCLFQWSDWKFAMLIFSLIPLSAAINVWSARGLPALYDREKKAYGRMLSLFTATVSFLMVIKSFRLEQFFRQKNRDGLDRYRKMRKERMRYESLMMECGRWFGHISRIFMLLLGAYFILHGEMTLGVLTSVILVSDYVGEGLKILGNLPPCCQNAKVSALRMNRLLQMEEETDEKSKIPVMGQNGQGTVYRVQDLSFSYSGAPALQEIAFCVEEGEKLAIVGPSGCGKTTLLKLLCGLYVPKEREIYFKGMDLAKVSAGYLKSEITAAAQETFLLQASVRDNIRIARPDAAEEELRMACRHARIDSFIETLPHQYDTELNTTVQSISKGQMQRINLARAFLRDTDVFLLDEPVSALDFDTAGKVFDYLFSDCGNKTLLVILHNLEEIHRFDRVLVLDQGKMAGFGTHQELLQSCGLYRQLYRETLSRQRKGEL